MPFLPRLTRLQILLLLLALLFAGIIIVIGVIVNAFTPPTYPPGTLFVTWQEKPGTPADFSVPSRFTYLHFPRKPGTPILKPLAGGPAQPLDRALLTNWSELREPSGALSAYLADNTKCTVFLRDLTPVPDLATLPAMVANLNATVQAWGDATDWDHFDFDCIPATVNNSNSNSSDTTSSTKATTTFHATLTLVKKHYQGTERFHYDIIDGQLHPKKVLISPPDPRERAHSLAN